nr:ribonuclease H-like domain-containing protein [Tanacetum cinerariifolium]
MWDVIKSRFTRNDESKKMQKYILKQQFKGFSVSNSEGLHKGFDRFQSLLSQLDIHGAGVSTKDPNYKFLRSLPSSWSQVSLIMRTKPGIDTPSFNDLYNNHRVFEYDIKGSTASSSGGCARASSTNYVNIASTLVNTASTPVNTVSTPVNTPSTPVNTASTRVNVASTPVNTVSTPVNTPSTPVNTASTRVNVASTPVNTTSTPVSIASPSRHVSVGEPSYPDLSTYDNQDDSQIHSLEDKYEVPSDGIFISVSYDDEGAVADFTKLESSLNGGQLILIRLKVLNTEAEGISVVGETLSAATLAVSTVSVQEASISTAEIILFLLGVNKMKEGIHLQKKLLRGLWL